MVEVYCWSAAFSKMSRWLFSSCGIDGMISMKRKFIKELDRFWAHTMRPRLIRWLLWLAVQVSSAFLILKFKNFIRFDLAAFFLIMLQFHLLTFISMSSSSVTTAFMTSTSWLAWNSELSNSSTIWYNYENTRNILKILVAEKTQNAEVNQKTMARRFLGLQVWKIESLKLVIRIPGMVIGRSITDSCFCYKAEILKKFARKGIWRLLSKPRV